MRRLAAATLLALALAGCGRAEGDGQGKGKGGKGFGGALEYPVEVMPAPTGTVEYRVTAVGSIEAFEQVQVTARVPGAVERVRFTEGESVRAGETLVEIDPARYRVAVEAARAAVARAEAALADAQAGLARRESANATRPGLIRAEDVETFRTRMQVATADVAAARAAVRQAELDLRDAYVRAPIAGVVETRSVDTGQWVQEGATLATMVRREPLLVRVDVPEPEAAPVRPGMPARVTVPGLERTFSAVITHVGGEAETTSRMVPVTARVDDPAREVLRPGAFAQVEIPIGASARVPVIPQTAVRPSERGFLAYVVENGVARERVLTLGMRTAEGRVEVRSGLAPGETLVVRGAEALTDGAKVKVEGAKGS